MNGSTPTPESTPTTLKYNRCKVPIIALEVSIRLNYKLIQTAHKLTLNSSTPTPKVIPTTLECHEFQMPILALEIEIRLDHKLMQWQSYEKL